MSTSRMKLHVTIKKLIMPKMKNAKITKVIMPIMNNKR
jgi:hypothetical protein